jgi:hypothetical protein
VVVVTIDNLAILVDKELGEVPLNIITKNPPFSQLSELVYSGDGFSPFTSI